MQLVCCRSIFTYQHTQGSTPRARWWSWCREIDSVLQSRWSPRPHTCRSYRGWSLRTSYCPQYAPLLRTHNLRRKIQSLVKLFSPVITMFGDLFTSTARTAGSRISHLMHTRQLGTLRRRTLHLTCLQDSERLALKCRGKVQIWREKRGMEESHLASAGGAAVWTQGPCLPVTELLSIKRAHWDQRQTRDKDRDKEKVKRFLCAYVCACGIFFDRVLEFAAAFFNSKYF